MVLLKKNRNSTILINALKVFLLFLIPNLSFGQAPDLGQTSGFALFTAAGAFGNSGVTLITGDIGSNSLSVTGFPPGLVTGTIHNPPDGITAQAAVDVDVAYGYLLSMTCDAVILTTLEGQTLNPGVSCAGAASSLNGNLTLNGGGDPNAIFIIKIGGALSVAASSNVILTNSASICNVYWQIGGQFELGGGSVFRGTAIVDGAINLLTGSSLFGRGLSRAGVINTDNNIIRFNPAAAGTITGITTVCQGQTGVDYSVPPIEDAESYNWTLPIGASGSSSTNNITVSYGTTAVSGNISVVGNNSCGGDGTASMQWVTVNPLPATSIIYHE